MASDVVEEVGEFFGDLVGGTQGPEAVVHPESNEGSGAMREGLAIKEVVQALVAGSGEVG